MSGACKHHPLFKTLQQRLNLLDQAKIDLYMAKRQGDVPRQVHLEASITGHVSACQAFWSTILKESQRFKPLSSDFGTTCPAGQGRAH